MKIKGTYNVKKTLFMSIVVICLFIGYWELKRQKSKTDKFAV